MQCIAVIITVKKNRSKNNTTHMVRVVVPPPIPISELIAGITIQYLFIYYRYKDVSVIICAMSSEWKGSGVCCHITFRLFLIKNDYQVIKISKYVETIYQIKYFAHNLYSLAIIKSHNRIKCQLRTINIGSTVQSVIIILVD